MRYGIFSDVHSNLEALQAVLAAYAGDAIGQYLCVGDVVGYGADPSSCIARVREVASHVVAGNHDWACVDKLSTRYFNPAAAHAVRWTSIRLSPEEQRFLSSLSLVFMNEELTLVHGTLDSPEEFDYMYDAHAAVKSLAALTTPLCFVGHSHVPGVFIQESDGSLQYRQDERCEIRGTMRCIVNVGSVGQPRDDNPGAAYCVYDSDKKSVEIKRVAYDVETARRKIHDEGLPHSLGDRLRTGR